MTRNDIIITNVNQGLDKIIQMFNNYLIIIKIVNKVFDKRVRSRLLTIKNRRIKLGQNKKIATIVFWHQSNGMPNFIKT